jgi:hypothetical protein
VGVSILKQHFQYRQADSVFAASLGKSDQTPISLPCSFSLAYLFRDLGNYYKNLKVFENNISAIFQFV